MRKTIIAGNWKMNMGGADTAMLTLDLAGRVQAKDNLTVIIAPVFPFLPIAARFTRKTALKLAAQNMHWHDNGAFTGEVSPSMLKEIGVEYVIVGHSERRAYFNEIDETVNLKVLSAIGHGLVPIMCCGESLEQRENGEMQAFVESQIEKGLAGLTPEMLSDIVIAYEPIWAIGTGKTATNEQAEEACAIIRRKVATLFGDAAAQEVSILYGGSVKPGNIAALTACPDIDGGLVGGASLNADDFVAIVENAVIK
jgi:triosephosphate isomerase